MLEVQDLTLKRGEKTILKRINLTVENGEIYGILGPNGAGKSSLAYTLMGCSDYQIAEGKIIFNGDDITAWQEPARFEGLSVQEYLLVGMKERNHTDIREALQGVLLDPDAYLKRKVDKNLSGGERKRIELAAIFTMRPRLAILDEPDSGIDLLALDKIMEFVTELKRMGSSVLLITHYADVAKIAERAALIGEGYVVKNGATRDVVDYFENKCFTCPKFK